MTKKLIALGLICSVSIFAKSKNNAEELRATLKEGKTAISSKMNSIKSNLDDLNKSVNKVENDLDKLDANKHYPKRMVEILIGDHNSHKKHELDKDISESAVKMLMDLNKIEDSLIKSLSKVSDLKQRFVHKEDK